MLRSIYYDDGSDEADAPAGSLRFASRVIGTMGAPVESQFEGHPRPEAWEDDEDIVYSPDPLATGLLDVDSLSTTITEKGQGPTPLEEVMVSREV
jgi:hypothetical protein